MYMCVPLQDYTNADNPFGDHHLLDKFVWHKVHVHVHVCLDMHNTLQLLLVHMYVYAYIDMVYLLYPQLYGVNDQL